MFEAIRKLIEAHEVIVLHRHQNPDGDALGSQIGLKHLILDNYPGKIVYAVGDAAGRYAFMEDSVMDEVPDAVYEGALAVVLDTSAKALISDGRYASARAAARIDHHLFCETITETEVVDSGFESCCGLIAAMAQESGWKLSPLSAKSLFTGMVTDSGRFRYDAVNARTFRLAAFLREQPFDTNELYNCLYAMDYEQVRLRAQFALKIWFTPHRVAYIYTSQEEKAQYHTDDFTLSRGMVNVMADIAGVHIWVNFTESDKGVLCELRSDRANINPVAVAFGGGGHQKASGATVPDRKTALKMLERLDKLAEEMQ